MKHFVIGLVLGGVTGVVAVFAWVVYIFRDVYK